MSSGADFRLAGSPAACQTTLMGMFSNLGKPVELEAPGPEHALEAAKAANRELVRKESLPTIAPPETPRGRMLRQLANAPPELTQERLEAYLEALAEVPHKARAALKAGLLLSQVQKLEREEPNFAAAVEMARLIASGVAEEEAFRRAVKGVTKAVWHQGVPVGTELEYSDTLMQKILEANEERYKRSQKIDASVSGSFNWLQMVQVVLSSDRSA